MKLAAWTVLGLVSLAACGSSASSSSVSAIAISPSPCAVGRTNSVQMSAVATLPNGTKEDVTSTSDWSTGDSNTATVNSSGVVVGVNAGVTKVSAEFQGATGSVDCTVGP